ncbi:MAG: hypothetical protein LBQ22_04410 [Bacteroidales bacterium]|jgi:hypothetical protein|nr:hypothetical protein [Bacteroidales bacterium]
MKSSREQLKDRGYIDINPEPHHLHLDTGHILQLLKSPIPYERSIAARLSVLISGYDKGLIVDNLIEALRKEDKLYTKI